MGKNLVVLSDGTWNTWGQSPGTNVVRLHNALVNDETQRLRYDAGVGTDFRKLTGGAFGVGISDNIKELYEFLCVNYRDGDVLFLFGFSRGAFTVRSLAGLLSRCGLLRKPTADAIDEAFALYKKPASEASAQFKHLHSIEDYRIAVLGVWDTVGALGVPFATLNRLNPFSHRFHDTRLSKPVQLALQALSVDENRSVFRPTLWVPSTNSSLQIIQQVWFAGSHSDIGGGYPEKGLSDITLSWMIRTIQHHSTGLRFKPTAQWGFDLAPDAIGVLHDERTGFYRLWEHHHRQISELATVHEALAERKSILGDGYHPKNLPKNVQWVDVE